MPRAYRNVLEPHTLGDYFATYIDKDVRQIAT